MPFRKTVYFLGAGASAHTGAPLLRDFLETAKSLVDGGSLKDDDADRFRRVFDYQRENDLIEAKVGLDLTNLEDLFGLVDLHVRVEPDKVALRDDLVFLLLRTLDLTIKDESPGNVDFLYRRANDANIHTHQQNRNLTEHFVDLVARRWDPCPSDGVTRDAIVTLNYDLVVDRALERRGLQPSYEIAFDSEPVLSSSTRVKMRLLKLHGSLNWARCHSGCRHVIRLSWDGSVPTRWLETACSDCGRDLEPLIVPPTWNKGNSGGALDSVWKAAYDELVSARRWVIIGTSLPATFRYLSYLFGLAVKESRHLDQILVINPQPGLRYGSLFEHLPHRITLSTKEWSFAGAIGNSYLQRELGWIGAQAGPSW